MPLPRRSSRFVADLLGAVLALADAVVVGACLLLAHHLRFGTVLSGIGTVDPGTAPDYRGFFILGTVLYSVLLFHFRLYQPQNLLRYRGMMRAAALASAYWLVAALALAMLVKFTPSISRLYLLTAAVVCLTGLAVWRGLAAWVLHREGLARLLRQRFLFIGWSAEAARLAESIRMDRSHPYELVGCVAPASGGFGMEPPAGVPVLGPYNTLEDHLPGVEVVVMAEADPGVAEILAVSDLCEREMVDFKVIPSFFRILLSGLHLHTISGVPILGLDRLPLDGAMNRTLKRLVDVAGALTGLVLTAPIMAVFAFRVSRESPGPVFYRQVRVGRRGRTFSMWKIRSMRPDAEEDGQARWAVPDDPRCLRVGAFMRRWNIDELPQFWNVLRGDMSLVGPRPERPELIAEFKKTIPHYNTRHWTKPGMTGWAQIHGLRGQCDLAERLRYDLYYMEHWSPALDAYIMCMTLLRYRNAY